MAFWRAFIGSIKVTRLYYRAASLKRRGRLVAAREELLRCGTFADGSDDAPMPVLSSFVAMMLSELSDRTACWDGEAAFLTKVVAWLDAHAGAQSKLNEKMRVHHAWLRSRLEWLQTHEKATTLH